MRLLKYLHTKNACYIAGKKMIPKGIMLHSTGANNPNLSRYVGSDDILGINKYNNHWNMYKPEGKSVCVHGFIGKLADGSIASCQTLPWDMVGWHSGSGSKGSANSSGYIGIEICEDNLENKEYFDKVYLEAVELFAYLCNEYNIKPEFPNIICHSEGYKLGIASNHSDVMHWFPKHGKSMDTFRKDIKELYNKQYKDTNNANEPDEYAKESWNKAKNKKIVDGTNPKSPVTRQQLTVILDRLGLLD